MDIVCIGPRFIEYLSMLEKISHYGHVVKGAFVSLPDIKNIHNSEGSQEINIPFITDWKDLINIDTDIYLLFTNDLKLIDRVIELANTKKASILMGPVIKFFLDVLVKLGYDQNIEFRSIIDAIQESVEYARKDGVVTYVNQAFCDTLGLEPKDRIGLNVFEEMPQSIMVQVLNTQKPVTGYRMKPRDSSTEIVVNGYPVFNSDNELLGVVTVSRDISDIANLTNRLSHNYRRLKTLQIKLDSFSRARYGFQDLIGTNKAFNQAVDLARKAANTTSTVLICGESGTGKELFAHAIHSHSGLGPFVRVNCAAIPDDLLESEFFGYEKGAFTGANSRKLGMFELADGGTIFLDEIGDMSLSLQGKLLRVLQNGEFTRLGGDRVIKVNVRVIAATNRNLAKLVNEGKFREDLYYRINVLCINIPPLRKRKEDIPLLAKHLLREISNRLGKRVVGISSKAMDMLVEYSWPGNVRELSNVIERAVNLCEGEIIESFALDLSDSIQSIVQQNFENNKNNKLEDIPSLAQVEKELIKKALYVYGKNGLGKKQAAEALGISISSLYNKIKYYNL